MRLNKSTALLAFFIVLLGCLPIIFYQAFFGGAPSVPPGKAKQWLAKNQAVLLDVRSAEEYAQSHLQGSANWPLAQIRQSSSAVSIPEEWRRKTLVFICNSGIGSVQAVRRLQSLGVKNLYSVSGGLIDWVSDAQKPSGRIFCIFNRSGGKKEGLPERQSPLVEQVALVASGFVIKPFYMLLSLALVLFLWKKKVKAADLVALKWGLLFFFLGEAFCSVNYFFFYAMSSFYEYLHSFGMVLSFAFSTYALFEALDQRLIHFSNAQERCAALALCIRCYKSSGVVCRFSRLFLFLSLAGMAVSFIPLTAQPFPVSYNTFIFGTYYNYANPLVPQVFEIRFCPLTALILFSLAFLVLLFHPKKPTLLSKIIFAAAAGYLGFSFLRLFLFAPFHDNLAWLNFWEEATEAVFITGTAIVLWLFRHGLFVREKKA